MATNTSSTSSTTSANNTPSSSSGTGNTTQRRIKFKRPRSRRACLTCRQRKVKCDVDQTYPGRCTNCIQFGIKECIIPESRHKRNSGKGGSIRHSDSCCSIARKRKILQHNELRKSLHHEGSESPYMKSSTMFSENATSASTSAANTPTNLGSCSGSISSKRSSVYPFLNYVKVEPGECLPSTNVNSSEFATNSPSMGFFGSAAGKFVTDYAQKLGLDRSPVDSTTVQMLDSAEAFTLPQPRVCKAYIDSYFNNIYPFAPVVNRGQFMRDYHNFAHPPSLLLLQTVIFAGARFLSYPSWSDKQRRAQLEIAEILQKRVQALFDADVESRSIPLCQAFVIFTQSCDFQLFKVRSPLHAIHMAIDVARSFKMDKDPSMMEGLSDMERRIRKRIWWSLVVEDRCFSMILGQHFSIDLGDCSVPFLTADDLSDETPDSPSPYRLTDMQVSFILQYIRCCLMMETFYGGDGLYGVLPGVSSSQAQPHSSEWFSQHVATLDRWYKNLPAYISYRLDDPLSHGTLAAYLTIIYHTLKIVLARSCITAASSHEEYVESNGPYWNVLFGSAHIIATISEKEASRLNNMPLMRFLVMQASMVFLVQTLNTDSVVSAIANEDSAACIRFLQSNSQAWEEVDFCCHIIIGLHDRKDVLVDFLRDLIPEEEISYMCSLTQKDLQGEALMYAPPQFDHVSTQNIQQRVQYIKSDAMDEFNFNGSSGLKLTSPLSPSPMGHEFSPTVGPNPWDQAQASPVVRRPLSAATIESSLNPSEESSSFEFSSYENPSCSTFDSMISEPQDTSGWIIQNIENSWSQGTNSNMTSSSPKNDYMVPSFPSQQSLQVSNASKTSIPGLGITTKDSSFNPLPQAISFAPQYSSMSTQQESGEDTSYDSTQLRSAKQSKSFVSC